jgi:hypothetical protein
MYDCAGSDCVACHQAITSRCSARNGGEKTMPEAAVIGIITVFGAVMIALVVAIPFAVMAFMKHRESL